MKKVFISLLIVLLVSALFVSCSDEQEATLTVNFLDTNGEEAKVLGENIESVEISLDFNDSSFSPVLKSASQNTQGIAMGMYVVQISGEDAKNLEGKSSLTVSGIPEGTFEISVEVDYEGGDRDRFMYDTTPVVLVKGKTTSVEVTLGDPV